MELLRHFTREEQVAGLEVRDDFVRLSFITQSREKGKKHLSILIESAVPSGVIIDGKVADANALVGALKELSQKIGKRARFVITAIPPHTAYYKHFSFPKTINERKLEEAMKLSIDFELPVNAKDVFLDWEKHSEQDSSDTALVAIDRSVAEEYVSCIKQAGLRVIALELGPQAIVRASAIDKKTYLIIDSDSSGTSFSVVKNREIVFMRTVPAILAGKDAIANEEKRVRRYCARHYGEPAVIYANQMPMDLSEYDTTPISEKDAKWLTALGASVRAFMPRGEDASISLMPIGTELAYEYHRAAAFSSFATYLIAGLSLFFIVGWLASFSLLVAVQQSFAMRINGLSGIPLSGGALALEQRAADINIILAKVGPQVKHIPRWSALVADIYATLPSTIKVTSLSAPSPDGTIQISGTAADRVALNNLKKVLQSLQGISNLNFPVQNITQRDNIPFSASFTFANPQKYYIQ